MSTENKQLDVQGFSCKHLEEQHAVFPGNYPNFNLEVRFKVGSTKNIEQGTKGICMAGINNICPKGHNCGQVTITEKINALKIFEVTPDEVILTQNTSEEARDECQRPPYWFTGLRAKLEKLGIENWGDVKTEDLPWLTK